MLNRGVGILNRELMVSIEGDVLVLVTEELVKSQFIVVFYPGWGKTVGDSLHEEMNLFICVFHSSQAGSSTLGLAVISLSLIYVYKFVTISLKAN